MKKNFKKAIVFMTCALVGGAALFASPTEVKHHGKRPQPVPHVQFQGHKKDRHHTERPGYRPQKHHKSELQIRQPEHHKSEPQVRQPEHHKSEPKVRQPEYHKSEPKVRQPEHHKSEPRNGCAGKGPIAMRITAQNDR